MAKGKRPMALNGGLGNVMLYLLLNTCGMVGNRKWSPLTISMTATMMNPIYITRLEKKLGLVISKGS